MTTIHSYNRMFPLCIVKDLVNVVDMIAYGESIVTHSAETMPRDKTGVVEQLQQQGNLLMG